MPTRNARLLRKARYKICECGKELSMPLGCRRKNFRWGGDKRLGFITEWKMHDWICRKIRNAENRLHHQSPRVFLTPPLIIIAPFFLLYVISPTFFLGALARAVSRFDFKVKEIPRTQACYSVYTCLKCYWNVFLGVRFIFFGNIFTTHFLLA